MAVFRTSNQRILDDLKKAEQSVSRGKLPVLNGMLQSVAANPVPRTSVVETRVETPEPRRTTKLGTLDDFGKKASDRADEYVKEYESIPNYNVFERMTDKEKAESYNKKNAMTSQYNEIMNGRIADAMQEASNYDFQFNGQKVDNAKLISMIAGTQANQKLHPFQYAAAKQIIQPFLEERGIDFSQLEDYYRTQAMQQQNREAQDFAEDHPVLATLNSVPTNVLSGMATNTNAVANYLSGNPLEANQSVVEYGKLVPAIRGTVRGNIKGDGGIGGTIGAGAYDVATSMGDMLYSMALGGGNQAATLGLMSSNAGANTFNEQLGKDTNPTQKIATSVASGVIEALTEKLPLDNLVKGANNPGVRQSVKQIFGFMLKQAGLEASEEAVSEIANNFADRLINRNQSEHEQRIQKYMAEGRNQMEAEAMAEWDLAKDTAYSALIGGISGGIMGGGSAMIGNTNYDNSVKNMRMESQSDARAQERNLAQLQKQTAEQNAALESAKAQIPQLSVARNDADADFEAGQNAQLAQLLQQAREQEAAEQRDAVRQQRFEQTEDPTESLNRQLAEAREQIAEEQNRQARTDEIINESADENTKDAYAQYKRFANSGNRNLLNAIALRINKAMDGKVNIPMIEPDIDLNHTETYNVTPTEATPQNTQQNDDGWGADLANAEQEASYQQNVPAVRLQNKNARSESTQKVPELTAEVKTEQEKPKRQKEMAEDTGFREARQGIDQGEATVRNTKDGEELVAETEFGDGSEVSQSPLTWMNKDPRFSTPEGQEMIQEAVERGDFNKSQNTVNRYGMDVMHDEFVDTESDRRIESDRQNLENDIANGKAENDPIVYRAAKKLANKAFDAGDTDKALYYLRKAQGSTTNAATIMRLAQQDLIRDLSNAVDRTDGLIKDQTEKYFKKHKKQKERCGKFAKALDDLVHIDKTEKVPKTHEQIVEGIRNVLESEFGSFEARFSDESIEKIADMIEQGVPTYELRNQIEHLLEHGNFYDYQQGPPDKKQKNAKLQNILNKITNDFTQLKPYQEKSYEQIRKEVKDMLENEHGSIFDKFTDSDVDFITNMVDQGMDSKAIQLKLEQWLTTGQWEYSKADLDEVNRLLKEARKYDNESKKGAELETKAYAIMADYLPASTVMEKWNQWRYLAMLGNPRTHIRNVIGNTIFGQTMETTSDKIGGLIESALYKTGLVKGDRTKTVKVASNAMKKKAGNWGKEHRWKSLTTGGKYYNTMKSGIEGQKKVFGNKAVQWASDLSSNALTAEDNFALEIKFRQEMANYLLANGKNESIFKSQDPADLAMLERAGDYAVRRAKEATFHSDQAFATAWNKGRNFLLNSDSKALNALGMGMDQVLPFVKTPLNITEMGVVNYTPAGLAKAIANAKNGNYTAAIENISRSLTGTGLLVLGAYLRSHGILRTKGDDDEKQLDKVTGEQDYSIRIGDKSRTLDWAAPFSIPLFLGAEMWRQFAEKGNHNPADVVQAIADPVMEMSMLQGINNTIESISRNRQKDAGMGTLAVDAAYNYASQGIPTLVKQVAKTVDETRRNTYYTGKEGADDQFGGYAKKFLNSLPVLSGMNQPQIDAWGEEQQNGTGNFLARLAQNTLVPWYTNDLSRDKTEQELYDLNKELNGGAKNVMPALAKTTPINGEGKLTPEDYTEWAKTSGQNKKKMYDETIENPLYQKLDAKGKDEMLNKVRLFSNALSLDQFTDKAKDYKAEYEIEDKNDYKKQYEAYKHDGTNGLVNYITITDNVKASREKAGRKSASKLDRVNGIEATQGLSKADKAYYLKLMTDYTKKANFIDKYVSEEYAYDWYKLEAKYGTKKDDLEYGISMSDLPEHEKQVFLELNALSNKEFEALGGE